jgi:hypothetical protein
MSAEIDEFSHTNDDFLVLVAAGNDGPYYYSVGAPATAKNILSVGASNNAGADDRQVGVKVIDLSGAEHEHDLEPADFGASLSGAHVYSGEVVASIPQDGCSALQAGLAGKVVLIKRGDCEFGSKALNAQNAGAAAAIIYNNVGGTSITMGSGASGASVTIPAGMITLGAGEAILAMGSGSTASLPHELETSSPAMSHEGAGAVKSVWRTRFAGREEQLLEVALLRLVETFPFSLYRVLLVDKSKPFDPYTLKYVTEPLRSSTCAATVNSLLIHRGGGVESLRNRS